MGEYLMADAIFAERRSEQLAERYRREWYQFRAIDRLETKLKLGKTRLGLNGQGFGTQQLEKSRQN